MYMGPMLPPVGRKWQLIYPNCSATYINRIDICGLTYSPKIELCGLTESPKIELWFDSLSFNEIYIRGLTHSPKLL